MKKAKRNSIPSINMSDWLVLAHQLFGDLGCSDESDDDFEVYLICDELACLVDLAHQRSDTQELLERVYSFARWSIRNTESLRVKECLSDCFFNGILDLSHAKKSCVEYLDWGDVMLFTSHYTVEPSFEDIDNFDSLCTEWKKRWSRNQRLALPKIQTEQDAALIRQR